MNYEQAVAFLNSRINFERFAGGGRPGRERIDALVELLDHPQRTFPSIHVTGTNGKFSVVRMCTSILGALGMTVGAHTSPDLGNVRERIAIGDEPIGEHDFARVVEYLAPFIQLVQERSDEELTYNEVLTAIALEYFFDRPVHAGVIEVGLGGEYDSTNVVDGKVAVITKIARDHIAQFGDDPVRAAWEKAGIIKAGATVVSGVDRPGLARIVDDRARERGAARVVRLGREFDVLHRVPAVGGQVIGIHGLEADYLDLFLPAFGLHQADNLAFAIAACEAFVESALDEKTARDAVAAVTLPGRLEVMRRRPIVIVDGAHNEDAAAAVLRTVSEEFVFDRLICVVGMMQDKPVEDVLALFADVVHRWVVTAPGAERAAEPATLARILRARGVPDELVTACAGVAAAVDDAIAEAQEDDLILVFGSFYTASEARAWLRDAARAGPTS